MSYPATELVLDKNGNVYHLGFSPADLADKIILGTTYIIIILKFNTFLIDLSLRFMEPPTPDL